ncbi:MAG: hypothetical protein IKQ47_07565 [Prevotella sp.]|nr:hypothetical protein [Prevotella sp.]
MDKVKSALHMKDAQLFLDECQRTHEPLNVTALKKDGTRIVLEGWTVTSSYWQRGTHDFRNPRNGQIRKVKDLLIFEINGHPVYI